MIDEVTTWLTSSFIYKSADSSRSSSAELFIKPSNSVKTFRREDEVESLACRLKGRTVDIGTNVREAREFTINASSETVSRWALVIARAL